MAVLIRKTGTRMARFFAQFRHDHVRQDHWYDVEGCARGL
jgi:hypothetical protein